MTDRVNKVQQISQQTLTIPNAVDPENDHETRRARTVQRDEQQNWGVGVLKSILNAPLKLFRNNARK